MSELRTTTSRVPDFLELLDRYPEVDVLHVPQLSSEKGNRAIGDLEEGLIKEGRETKQSRRGEFHCKEGGGGI